MREILQGTKPLDEQINAWKREGRRIVFTNGVFDVLHVGHLVVLEQAALEGDKLIVAINSDASVRRLGKGEDRPINSDLDRGRLLMGLGCVDAVVIFDEDTPAEAIAKIHPDVLVKGGDYSADCLDPNDSRYIVGSQEIRARGGEVKVIPILAGKSTTRLLERIRSK